MVRRLHGTANPHDYFAKTFAEYKTGFSSNGELWLGLDKLHALTTGGSYGLRVTMKDWDNKEYTAVYGSFKVGPGDGYVLSISGFDSKSSTLGDSMAGINGMKFSAKDRDQDIHGNKYSCSNNYSNAGWWFAACHNALPTGMNSNTMMVGPQYIVWLDAGARGFSWKNFKEAEFLIVPN